MQRLNIVYVIISECLGAVYLVRRVELSEKDFGALSGEW